MSDRDRMRIERLEVLRFGKFTEQALDFPSRAIDFHVIVGANEAGKSTVRAAITDLLFGIEPRTPYSFMHHYSDLRLGAVITKGERRQPFQRVKRMKNPLRDAADRPLRDDLLMPFIGEMDRAAFERMFCLDHERLVRGGDEILTAKDDVARLLFETSSGIGHFGSLCEALEEEAKSLWDKRRSGDRAFYRAYTEWRAAEDALKAATVRARDWAEVEKRAQAAREVECTAREAHHELELKRTRLERIRRLAPSLGKLHADLKARAELGAVVRLPLAARSDLDQAEGDMADAEVVLAQAEKACADATGRTEAIRVDEHLLEAAPEVSTLAERRALVLNHPRDLERRRAELRIKVEDAQRIAGQLGWEGDEAALAAMLPPQALVAELRELLETRDATDLAASSATKRLREHREKLDALEAPLAALEQISDNPALRVAVQTARAAGDLEQKIEEAHQKLETLQRRVRERLELLAPWRGNVETLRSIVLPSEEEARAHRDEELKICAALDTEREELERLASDEAVTRARAEQLRHSRRPVTLEALEEARRDRDAVFRDIRERKLELDAAAGDLESRIATTDWLADQRFSGASDVLALEQAETQLVQLQAQHARQQEVVTERERALQAHAGAWNETMRAVGLEGERALRLPGWSSRRKDCLDTAERLAEQQAELASLESRAAEVRRLLEAALDSRGSAGARLRVLLAEAEEQIRRLEAGATRREALLENASAARAELGSLEADVQESRLCLEDWQRRWSRQVAVLNFASDIGFRAASQNLNLLSELERTLREASELRRSRIEAMQRDLEEFAAEAASLAAHLAPEFAAEPPEAVACELERRLREAQSLAGQRAAALADVERQRRAIDAAQAAYERAAARVRPLMSQASVGDLASLRPAIERSEALRALDEAIERSRAACLEGGDGLALETLEEQAAAEDVATVPAKLKQLNDDLKAQGERCYELNRELARAEAELESFGRRSDTALAPLAEAARQEALAAMADSIERYIKVFVASRLLRWCIERYRREKQGPLLKRASELFAVLTLNSFERLEVEHDGQSPQLKGRRTGSKLVDVAGMSEGTRDQLYFALRLAALEMQLDHGRALPFVADDLFINFDDERAVAGFRALFELAEKTQVIFLTHHEHLLPLIEDAIGSPEHFNVVRLG